MSLPGQEHCMIHPNPDKVSFLSLGHVWIFLFSGSKQPIWIYSTQLTRLAWQNLSFFLPIVAELESEKVLSLSATLLFPDPKKAACALSIREVSARPNPYSIITLSSILGCDCRFNFEIESKLSKVDHPGPKFKWDRALASAPPANQHPDSQRTNSQTLSVEAA